MKVAYIRVSTVEQNDDRQIKDMEKLGIEKFFIEKASGKDINRPELNNMIEFVRDGDIVYIESFSRLARSTQDLLNIIEQLQSKGVDVVSLKEKFDLTTATGKLMVTMLGAISTFERDIMLERQRDGIAIAKEKGKYKGRKSFEIDEKFKECYTLWETRKLKVEDFMKEIGIKSKTTFYKMKAEYEEEGK